MILTVNSNKDGSDAVQTTVNFVITITGTCLMSHPLNNALDVTYTLGVDGDTTITLGPTANG